MCICLAFGCVYVYIYSVTFLGMNMGVCVYVSKYAYVCARENHCIEINHIQTVIA